MTKWLPIVGAAVKLFLALLTWLKRRMWREEGARMQREADREATDKLRREWDAIDSEQPDLTRSIDRLRARAKRASRHKH